MTPALSAPPPGVGIDRLADYLCELGPSPAGRPATVHAGRPDGPATEVDANPKGDPLLYVFRTVADPFVGQVSLFKVLSGTVANEDRLVNAVTGTEERLHGLFKLRGKEHLAVERIAAGDIGAVAKLAASPTGSTLAKRGMTVHVTGPAPRPTPYALALNPLTQADDDKLSSALQRLVGEDPTLLIDRSADSGQTILRGTGDTHIAVALERLSRKFGVNVSTEEVRIPYRETIAKTTEAEGKLKKQSGGHGQFAVCQLRVSPVARGDGTSFVDRIVGGSIPRNYIPAVEKGIFEAMSTGGVHGFPVVDVQVEAYDGKFHPVDSGQTILRGTGDTHIAVALERLSRKFGVNVSTEEVRIPYRETIARKIEAEGKLKKQSGGHGQYAVCQLRVSPVARGEGTSFVDHIVGGSIPRNYIPAVEKGVFEAMTNGGVHGFPVVDVEVECYEGKFHPVDSSDMAFRTAGAIGLKEALAKAGTVVLEPISLVTVIVPSALQGDVMGDLSSRRGRIAGATALDENRHQVQALVPEAEVQRYVLDLRSLTGGRGTFTAVHDHYDIVPAHLVDKIAAAAKAAKDPREH